MSRYTRIDSDGIHISEDAYIVDPENLEKTRRITRNKINKALNGIVDDIKDLIRFTRSLDELTTTKTKGTPQAGYMNKQSKNATDALITALDRVSSKIVMFKL